MFICSFKAENKIRKVLLFEVVAAKPGNRRFFNPVSQSKLSELFLMVFKVFKYVVGAQNEWNLALNKGQM